MEAPDPNAVEPTRTPSNRESSADGEKNPYAYGSDKWHDWKIKRNGGKLRAGMSFNESNKRVAEDVRPVLEVTGDLCLSAATGPYRDIIEIGTGKDMWDQRELSGTERTVQAALTFGIPLVGAVVGNFIEYGSKLARGVNRASRAGEQVEDVLQSGLRVASNVGPNSVATIASRMRGTPAAIFHQYADLSKRQQGLLSSLGEYGSQIIVSKRGVSMKDLAALTAQTGDEFLMLTRRGLRLIMRGSQQGFHGLVDEAWAKSMAGQGWRWSGHTHPVLQGMSDLGTLMSSDGDHNILRAFGQLRSLILNSKGRWSVFGGD